MIRKSYSSRKIDGYKGSATLGHEEFLVAGLPVENIVGESIGAFAVGISESELLKSLDEATQRTLLGAALLSVDYMIKVDNPPDIIVAKQRKY